MLKVREVENSIIAKFIGVGAIVLYPFVFYSGVPGDSLRRHEMHHVRQIRRTGFFRFYFSYLLYWMAGLTQGKSSFQSYYDIPWEVEAREQE